MFLIGEIIIKSLLSEMFLPKIIMHKIATKDLNNVNKLIHVFNWAIIIKKHVIFLLILITQAIF